MPRPKRYESMTDYKNQYIAENYDRINLTVPKGRKQEIKDRATTRGMSANEYINKLIEKDLEAGK